MQQYTSSDDSFHMNNDIESQPILEEDEEKDNDQQNGLTETQLENGARFLPHEDLHVETKMLLSSPTEQVKFILGENCNAPSNPSDVIPRLFTELVHLKQFNNDYVWKERARWIKFEEVVEEGGDRWSKPHVPSLSLHSVFELRSSLASGVILFDVSANSMQQISDTVLDQLMEVENGLLSQDTDNVQKIRKILLSKHEHQGEKKQRVVSLRGSQLKRSQSMSSSRCPDFNNTIDFDNDEKKFKVPYFTKKIPAGAEAANVLVGEVPFLQQRIVAFIRLQESVYLGQVTEVPIPSRFIFLLLGPPGHLKQYNEIGRSMATLLTDQIFHQVAYKAKTREDLLSGIDEFLDQVTVLPPCTWNSKTRLDPPKELPENYQKNRLKLDSDRWEEHDGKEELQPHQVPPELQRTGRLFGGLINDIKRKAPFYASDFKDCFNIQCLATFIFLYFAILTPIVTFGGLLQDATHNYLGTMESLFGGAISGITYHFFSGQPLTIIGSTGPILVFEKIMFEICTIIGFKYISFRFWVGVWTGFICILLVAFDVSSLITYVTRFTEESFSALISFIFIYEAVKKLVYQGSKQKIWYGWNPDRVTLYECDCVPPNLSNYNISHNVTFEEMAEISKEYLTHNQYYPNEGTLFKMSNLSYVCAYEDETENITNYNDISWMNLTKSECLITYCGDLQGEACKFTPDAMFMSVVLFFGTFVISVALKGIKTSRYFPTKVRSIISDFAVTIAIALMVGFDMIMDISTAKLKVPKTFRPTRDDRGWVIDPFDGNPWWSALVALIPALLATILIFMDQQITAVIVNRRENKLKKSCGYHLDLLIVAVMLIICSVMGLPWFVAATVLSITHVNSLRVESETSAPGDVPKFYGIREQRVTGIMIFLTIGISVFLTPVLAHIPMAVLYGVFLYMGVSSLRGVQFFDRIKLFFMPSKHQPDYIYLRNVKITKVYLFTALQMAGLAVLWFIKSTSPISIVFPMMVAALIGIRKLFDFGPFSRHDLYWLDDLMPESARRKKEDEKKKRKRNQQRRNSSEVNYKQSETGNLPFEVKYRTDGTTMNITEEVERTATYRSISSGELGGNGTHMRNRSIPSNGSYEKGKAHIYNGSDTTEQAALLKNESDL